MFYSTTSDVTKVLQLVSADDDRGEGEGEFCWSRHCVALPTIMWSASHAHDVPYSIRTVSGGRKTGTHNTTQKKKMWHEQRRRDYEEKV